MSWMEKLEELWFYTHLSEAERQQGLFFASSHHAASAHVGAGWKSYALTEILYRDNDVLSKAFAIASLLPLVIVVFLAGLASAPCRERRLPALNLLLYLILSVAVNVTCKISLRSPRPAHPAARMNYTTIHGMPSDHAQFMAGVAVYLLRRWDAHGPPASPMSLSPSSPSRSKSERSEHTKKGGVKVRQLKHTPMPRLLSAFLFCAALFVGVGRVYNGYHTVGQVVVGWVVGALLEFVCTTAAVQRVQTWVSKTVMLPVMLVCTYWTNAVC